MSIMGKSIGQARQMETIDFSVGNPTSMPALPTNGDTVMVDGSETGTDPLFGGVETPTDPGGVEMDIGVVSFPVGDMTVTGNTLAGPALVSEDEAVTLHVYWTGTEWETATGGTTFTMAGDMTDTVHFAVDGDGNTAVIIADTIVGPNDQSVLGGLFADKTIIAGVMADPNGSEIESGTNVEIDVTLEPAEVVDVVDDTVGLVGGTVGRLF